jgi:hypothetical protein
LDALSRLLQRRRSLSAAAPLFTLTAGFVAVRTGRDALYIVGDGLFGLPRAYVAAAMLAIPQAMVLLWLLRRFGTRLIRPALLAFVALLMGLYSVFAEAGASWTMTAFFLSVPLLFSVAFSVVWLLGSELFDTLAKNEATAAFSHLGAASILGGVFGGIVARVCGPWSGPRALIGVGAALVFAAFGMVVAVQRAFPSRGPAPAPAEPTPAPGMTSLMARPTALLLLGVAMAGAVTGIFVDFQFYLGAVGGDEASNTIYFANVYLVLGCVSLLLQLVVAPWLHRSAGVQRSLLVLPLALVGGAALVLASATNMARAGLRVVEGGIKAGVHRSTWEQAFLSFPKRDRAHVRVMVDGMGTHLAEGMASVALLIWMRFAAQGNGVTALRAVWVAEVSATWVTVAVMVSALAWSLLTWSLARRMRQVSKATAAVLPDSFEGATFAGSPAGCCEATMALGLPKSS